MNPRKYLWLPFLLFASSLTQAETSNPREKPLNIIFIMADDLGYETIGANGQQARRLRYG